MSNYLHHLKKKLSQGELEQPTALVAEILTDLNVSLMKGQVELMRSNNADEFAQALSALHGTLRGAETEVAAVVEIAQDRKRRRVLT